MAANSNEFPACRINFFVWFFIFMSVAVSSSSAQCSDATYKHEGRDCCLCAAGYHLKEHCNTSLKYGTCIPCEKLVSYRSVPNSQNNCERCTSCSHLNANLEVDEDCTPARDTKCRCKKDHYCDTETCILCQPCKECGPEGIKVPCVGKNDTICNDKGNLTGIIVGLIVGILLLVAVVVAVLLWKKGFFRNRKAPVPLPNGHPADVELQPINGVDLQPHLSDVADVIGWKDMKAVAMSSKIPNAIIESCQLNHPGDAQEQTLELLGKWVEREGMQASSRLIQILERLEKRGKAAQVTEILSHGT